jgi:hypothetical protein
VLLHDQRLDLTVPEDFAELEQALAEHRPRLVILDPIVAYLGAKTDAYRANEVRAVLAPLARLAERHGCAMLAVRHLRKARGSRSIYAGQGSIDFTAAPRSVLLAGWGAEGEAERALVHIKSNLAGAGPTLAYRIDEQGSAGPARARCGRVICSLPSRPAATCRRWMRRVAFCVVCSAPVRSSSARSGPLPAKRGSPSARCAVQRSWKASPPDARDTGLAILVLVAGRSIGAARGRGCLGRGVQWARGDSW